MPYFYVMSIMVIIEMQLSFLPPVIVDEVPLGKKFGDLKEDVKPEYRQGDIVSVTFHGANPRNNLMPESTYLEVQMQGKSLS